MDDCPNTFTRSRRGSDVCEIHYDGQEGCTNPRVDVSEISECEACGFKSLNSKGTAQRLITHHVTYSPEETIEVCDRCHQRIHNGELPEFQPSVKQKWMADLDLRVEDVKRLSELGNVRIQGLGVGKVSDDYVGGYKFSFVRKDGSRVFSDRRYHQRSEVEFLEEKPWNSEPGVVKEL